MIVGVFVKQPCLLICALADSVQRRENEGMETRKLLEKEEVQVLHLYDKSVGFCVHRESDTGVRSAEL